MATVHGYCDHRFNGVRDVFQDRIFAGEELGASLCVNIDGENVIDLWGGHADTAKTRPWNEDTLVAVWYCSKVATALAAVFLIDRGLLDADKKVSEYWPEFAANGKENVTVAHILSHTSGVPSWERPVTIEETYCTKSATELVDSWRTLWVPPVQPGPSSRRTFVSDSKRKGCPRAADVVPPPALPIDGLDSKSIMISALSGPVVKAEDSMTRGFREAEIGAANGFGNARSLCRIGSIVSLAGTVDGKQYISSRTVDKMIQERIHVQDLVLSSVL